MTPQERDLITALFDRLNQQRGISKDPEAESLIQQREQQQPDAAYLLVQTVLIQDMALHEAQNRIAEYERQRQTAAAPQGSSFLPGRQGAGQSNQSSVSQGQSMSAPPAGPWGARPAEPAAPPARSVWSQSYAPPQAPQPQQAPPPPPAYGAPAYGGGYGPQMLAGSGGGFLRQAASTAAGVVGGSLLFQGISSMFGPHYGSGFMGSMPMQQPGLSETVINNYYNDDSNAQPGTDTDYANDPGQQGFPDDQGATQADYTDNQAPDNQGWQDPGQDPGQDQDFDPGSDPGQDFGNDDGGNYDV